MELSCEPRSEGIENGDDNANAFAASSRGEVDALADSE